MTKGTNHNLGIEQGLAGEALLHWMTNRIRQSLELQEILTATVVEVRSFLKTDRVMVYRFHTDGSGEVIAESIHNNRLPTLLGLNFPVDDIPPHARELFLRARSRSIVNVETGQIGLSLLDTLETEDIRYRPVDPCHIEYLTAMGVLSSLVLPILHLDAQSEPAEPSLWGLLVSHHSESRSISERELELVQLVADQVSVAIAQANLLKLTRERVQREAAINRIATLLHSLPMIELQAALEETVNVLQGVSGRIYIKASSAGQMLYTCGPQPILNQGKSRQIEESPVWQEYNQRKEGSLWTISDLYKEPQLRVFAPAFKATQIRGLLSIPLQYRQEFFGYLTIFRNEIDTETLWAGHFDPDERQLQPRHSFEIWRELKRGQAQEWTAENKELAQALGYHFSMAIQQYLLYQQVKMLNANLEYQVQERTAKSVQAVEQQQTLFRVVTKIRESLDLDTILKATTTEVRQMLNADRVGIFRFHPNSGWNTVEFVAEEVLPGFTSAMTTKIQDHCFGEKYALQYQQGRIQVVDDIYNAHLADCHIQLLSQFQVRANLIVPLLKGEELWGLLCIHQCSAPRHWEDAEIEFVTQIAAHLGVALQQTDLLTQTRWQAEQLTQVIHDLQQTQTQLIQTEKMSSLGQLVAGVAHEINNPVNFIYGNINHASDYIKELLDLLQLYTKYYPNPVPAVSELRDAIDIDFLVEDLPKILSSMRVGTDRIRAIVLSLRNFSRLDQAEMKPVNLHEGIESTLLILQHRLRPRPVGASIEVVKEYGDLPPVECYAGQLNQVFMNILGNSIDSLHEEGGTENRESQQSAGGYHKPTTPTIRIRTEVKDGKYAVVRIADNGLGMTEAVKGRIFDPFFTTKPVGQGTGLGLAISYQIVVDKHGGAIHCISQPGEGTEFWIEIPLKPLHPCPS